MFEVYRQLQILGNVWRGPALTDDYVWELGFWLYTHFIVRSYHHILQTKWNIHYMLLHAKLKLCDDLLICEHDNTSWCTLKRNKWWDKTTTSCHRHWLRITQVMSRNNHKHPRVIQDALGLFVCIFQIVNKNKIWIFDMFVCVLVCVCVCVCDCFCFVLQDLLYEPSQR